MSSLLIHSMAEFAPIILQCLADAKARHIVEIGAEYGGMSLCLAQYCHHADGTLVSIDPAARTEFLVWSEKTDCVHHIAQPSLMALPDIPAADAWVIDGDHNYYTVFNELLVTFQKSVNACTPYLAFVHDISWPCARRDFYYAPDTIPPEYLHPHSYEAGVTLNNSGVLHQRGLRGEGQFAIALHEGGPRNGVLSAVEDFLSHMRAKGTDLVFAHIPAVFGLGVLFDAEADWAEIVAGSLLPYHCNDLIARMELNRLMNYLAVIDWQDRENERLAYG
ncbi:MAG: class I SAM-dependent methyltransferase [Sphingomonadaceae bacterium]